MSRSDSGDRDAATDFGDLGALEARIGHRFTDRALLHRALNHRSWCAEHPGDQSNERLEFLGDAVLGWAVADISYRLFESHPGRAADRSSQERRQRAGARRRGTRDRSRATHPPRPWRVGGGWFGEAVDPVGCVRGGARCRVSRRRHGGRARDGRPPRGAGLPVDHRGSRPDGQQDPAAGVGGTGRQECADLFDHLDRSRPCEDVRRVGHRRR